MNAAGGAGTTISLGDTSGSNFATLWYSANAATTPTKAGIVVRAGSTGTKSIANTTTGGALIENTAITLNDDLTINDSELMTLGGVISGTGGLTKTNVGTTTLTGTNTYTGNTTITAGTLQIDGAGLESGATGFYSGNITIASGAIFQYSSSASNTAARYDGTISGDGTLIKDGSTSILRLQGTTSVANIEINQGTLRVQGNAGALGGAGTTVTIGASGSENAILNYSGSNVTYTGKTAIVVGAGSSGTKTIQNGGGTNNVENTNITLNDNVIIDDSGAFTLGGVISESGGAFGLTKTNSGTTTLSGANTYTGTTTISAGNPEPGRQRRHPRWLDSHQLAHHRGQRRHPGRFRHHRCADHCCRRLPQARARARESLLRVTTRSTATWRSRSMTPITGPSRRIANGTAPISTRSTSPAR